MQRTVGQSVRRAEAAEVKGCHLDNNNPGKPTPKARGAEGKGVLPTSHERCPAEAAGAPRLQPRLCRKPGVPLTVHDAGSRRPICADRAAAAAGAANCPVPLWLHLRRSYSNLPLPGVARRCYCPSQSRRGKARAPRSACFLTWGQRLQRQRLIGSRLRRQSAIGGVQASGPRGVERRMARSGANT